MGISEKLTTIAENIPKVYKAGQSSMVDESKIIEKTVSGESVILDDVSEIPHEVKVKLTSETLTDYSGVTIFAGASENEITKTLTANADGTVEGIKSTSPYMYFTTDNKNVTINATYHKSYGMQTEYDRFWDSYQRYGELISYNYAFQSNLWTDDNYNPKYPINASYTTNLYVNNTNITDTKVPIIVENGRLNNTFSYAKNLVTIRELVVSEKTINADNNAFRGLNNLVNFKITGVWAIDMMIGDSNKLSKDSILSIFNALSATATTKTLTLSKTAVINAFGSTTATEWTNLVATKTNWTISLI